jgi:prephenate dehydrogenase
MPIGQLAVVGVGLIGASFALALKSAKAVERVIGIGRSRANLEHALASGAIDQAADDAAAAIAGADLILVATPVGAMGEAFARIAPHLAARAVLTDAGSVKQSVIADAREALGPKLAQFVPAHPIAGSDESGARAASPALYQGREVILTPLAESAPQAIARVRDAWLQCGARVTEMNAADHDAIFAAVSHLPHLASYALVQELAGRIDAERLLSHAGAGLRDFSRLAASHPEMWRDICLANRAAIIDELRRYQGALTRLATALERRDGAALAATFAEARAGRRAWLGQAGDRLTRESPNAGEARGDFS